MEGGREGREGGEGRREGGRGGEGREVRMEGGREGERQGERERNRERGRARDRERKGDRERGEVYTGMSTRVNTCTRRCGICMHLKNHNHQIFSASYPAIEFSIKTIHIYI